MTTETEQIDISTIDSRDRQTIEYVMSFYPHNSAVVKLCEIVSAEYMGDWGPVVEWYKRVANPEWFRQKQPQDKELVRKLRDFILASKAKIEFRIKLYDLLIRLPETNWHTTIEQLKQKQSRWFEKDPK